MRRKRDIHSAGRSHSVAYCPAEADSDRHDRRLAGALESRVRVRAWCGHAGIALSIRNHGHHWCFTRGAFRAEWWPSSAKFVFCGQWEKGVHIHDAEQLIEELARRFGVRTENGGNDA